MIKLTKSQFEATQASRKHQIITDIKCQLVGLFYREDMENMVFQEDVSSQFLVDIKEKWDCDNWDDSDLIEWIRDIQHDCVDSAASSVFVSLERYIAERFKSQAEFAKKQGVKPPQITQWLEKDFIVADGVLYSPRRDLEL